MPEPDPNPYIAINNAREQGKREALRPTRRPVLPDNILRCLSAKDRQELGQKTACEVLEAGEAKSERALQKQIVGLLRLKGIEPIVSRMDRRTSNNLGTPDILFAVDAGWGGRIQVRACAWEIKMPQGKLSKEQTNMANKMTIHPNCWCHRVIRSVDDALRELREMGVA